MMRQAMGVAALVLLSACGSDQGLRVYDAGNGPDEFSVIPARPLTIPETLSLPQPTPGGTNITDPAPVADAILALGGNPAPAGGVPAQDAALVAAVGPASPGIREELAAEDAAFRARASTFRLGGGDRYFSAYARQALDAYAELARFAALGVQVPTAPPLE